MSHLDSLEAESIYIIREVVAEASHPAMLYSIGKDSSVMLRLAQKAFYPGKIPFPLVHIDTGFKFREMIEFRDQPLSRTGRATDRPHQYGGVDRTAPIRSAWAPADAARCSRPRRCSTRWPRITSTSPWVELAATKKNRAPKNESSPCAIRWANGIPKNQRPEFWNLYNVRLAPGQSSAGLPALELD